MKPNSANFFALDIGSNKIAALAAYVSKYGQQEILAHSIHQSEGITSGRITDIEKAEGAIIRAIYGLEKECEQSIKKTSIAISGLGSTSYFLRQKIKLGSGPVTEADLRRLIQRILLDFKVPNQQILHYFPLEYVIDGAHAVDNPIGMYGKEIACELHIVAASTTLLKNLVNCLAKFQIEVENISSAIYCSTLACLTPDEHELGSIMIDIGARTTGFAICLGNKLVYQGQVNEGGEDITDDIAKHFSISRGAAEKIKILHGQAVINSLNNEHLIMISDYEDPNMPVLDRSITNTHLAKVIVARLRQILLKVNKTCQDIGLESQISRRVVITGGSATINGLKTLSTDIFKKQIRIARPSNITGLSVEYNPYVYSSSVGLVKSYCEKKRQNNRFLQQAGDLSLLKRAFNWLKENI